MKVVAEMETSDPFIAITILNRLATAYHKQGNFGEAIALRQKISETRKVANIFFAGVSRHLPAELLDTHGELKDCKRFALCLRDAGRFQESIDMFMEC